MAIIHSLLQLDMYKLTMLQVFLHKFPGAFARYRFKLRNKGINLLKYKDKIQAEINHLCTLKFESHELDYLRKIPHFTEDFILFLEHFSLKRKHITLSEVDGELDIYVDGPIIYGMMFEIYILSIVHEVYSKEEHTDPDYLEGEKRLMAKIDKVRTYIAEGNVFQFADFGTRRAFTHAWHDNVVKILSENLSSDVFVGTSCVYLAMKYDIKPIGTFAHEYVQAFQGLGVCQLKDSQKVALQTWTDEYRGDLGICLSDTLGLDKFLKDFDLYFAKLFDGVRHDSGCPFEFTNRIVAHYKKLGIDPKTKTIVFSDGLDIDLAIELAEHCKGKIKCSFGIGTNISNDLGYTALQIVIKMFECGINEYSMTPVAKISDNPAKTMCENKEFLDYIYSVVKMDTRKVDQNVN